MLNKKRLAFFLIVCYLSTYLILILSYINPLGFIYNNLSNKDKRDPFKGVSIVNKKLRTYIKDDYIADAIYQNTTYPQTLAAIAAVESQYKPQVVGDGGDSYGLFQIQAKHWGEVPDSIPNQVRKCDAIFRGHVQRYGYYGAIKRYNGSGRGADRYLLRVLQVKKEIERIKV